jgi:hypothetical protein
VGVSVSHGIAMGLQQRLITCSVSPSAVALVDDLAEAIEPDIAAGDRHPDAFVPTGDLAGQHCGERGGPAQFRDELEALEAVDQPKTARGPYTGFLRQRDEGAESSHARSRY